MVFNNSIIMFQTLVYAQLYIQMDRIDHPRGNRKFQLNAGTKITHYKD